MKEVIATAVGFHGSLRQPDDTFEVEDDAKASWFKDVPKAKPAKKGQAQGDATGGEDSLT